MTVRAAGETFVAHTPEELRGFVDRIAKQAFAEMKRSVDLATASRKSAGQSIDGAALVTTLEEPLLKWISTFKDLVGVVAGQIDSELAEIRSEFAELEAVHAAQQADLAAIKATQSRGALPVQKTSIARPRPQASRLIQRGMGVSDSGTSDKFKAPTFRDEPQYVGEQIFGNGDLGHLKRYVTTVARFDRGPIEKPAASISSSKVYLCTKACAAL